MNTNHTPGPWYINGPWNVYASEINGISRCVAHIVPGNNISLEERGANASLIVAAPELLVALKAIADDTTHPIQGALQAQARAAIAKAEKE